MAQKPPDLDENLKPIIEKPPDLDENLKPVEQPSEIALSLTKGKDEPVEDVKTTPEEDKQIESGLSKFWHTISDPLTEAPSRAANRIADIIDQPSLDRSPLSAELHGFGAGAVKGIGNIVSSLTSPLNLATSAFGGLEAGALRSELPAIAKALSYGTKALSAPVAAEGAMNLFGSDKTVPERIGGGLELAGGLFGMGHRVPEIAQASPEITSKITPDLNVTGDLNVMKRSLRLQPDGSLIDKSSGEVVYDPSSSKPLPADNSTTRPQFNPRKQTGMTGSQQKPPDIEPEVPNEETQKPNIKIDPRTQALLDKRNSGQLGDVVDKKQSAIKEALNLPKSIMASYDLSAPGRQGLPLITNKAWWTSWGSMVKSLGSEAAFRDVQESIANKPLFKDYGNGSFASKVGLHLSDLTNLSNREEQIMSNWAEKLPGVRASNRAYTAYLNKLRADTFENLMNNAKVLGTDGEFDLPAAKKIASFVNVATGRGSLGPLEKYATELNSVFFSPRMMASRIQILDPRYYWAAPPALRRQAIRSLFAIAGTGSLIGQLVKWNGLGTVESDPASSDFGKIKIGNTRIDLYGGFQQPIVAANKILQNREVSTTSGKNYELGKGFRADTRNDVAWRFTRSKLNPALTLALDIAGGKDPMTGKPLDVPEAIVQRFVPLFLQDLKTVATENPNLIPGYHDTGMSNFDPERAMLAIPGAFGAGIQNYPSKR